MEDRTHNGVKFRILNVIDEYTRECLAVKVVRRLTSHDVDEVLTELFIERGVPVYSRSDNGFEFIAKRVKNWLERLQVRPLYIEPSSPIDGGKTDGGMKNIIFWDSILGKVRLCNTRIFP